MHDPKTNFQGQNQLLAFLGTMRSHSWHRRLFFTQTRTLFRMYEPVAISIAFLVPCLLCSSDQIPHINTPWCIIVVTSLGELSEKKSRMWRGTGLREFRKRGNEMSGISGTVSFFHDAIAYYHYEYFRFYAPFVMMLILIATSTTVLLHVFHHVHAGHHCRDVIVLNIYIYFRVDITYSIFFVVQTHFQLLMRDVGKGQTCWNHWCGHLFCFVEWFSGRIPQAVGWHGRWPATANMPASCDWWQQPRGCAGGCLAALAVRLRCFSTLSHIDLWPRSMISESELIGLTAKVKNLRQTRPVVMDHTVREPATTTPFGHTGYMKYLCLQIVQKMDLRNIAISGQYYGSSYTPETQCDERNHILSYIRVVFVVFVLRRSASKAWSSQETQILEWMHLKKQPMDGMIIMFAPGKDDRDSNLVWHWPELFGHHCLEEWARILTNILFWYNPLIIILCPIPLIFLARMKALAAVQKQMRYEGCVLCWRHYSHRQSTVLPWPFRRNWSPCLLPYSCQWPMAQCPPLFFYGL